MRLYMKVLGLLFVLLMVLSGVSAEVAPSLEDAEGETEVLFQTGQVYLDDSNFTVDVDVKNRYEALDMALLELDADHFEVIGNRSFIDRVEPNYRTEALLSDSNDQINSRPAWESNFTGEGVSVAVMDSGIANHQYLEVSEQRDYTGEGVGDLNGHGTHVAGIIGSTQQNFRGVAYESELHDLKVLDESGRGRGDRLIRAIDYSIRNDIDVAVLSLGTELERCNGNDAMSQAVDTAVENGVVMVAAAGNTGPDSRTITSPGCSRQALTVGSVDKNDRMAHYSSRGPTSDGRVKPDVVAPGTNIGSTGLENSFIRRSGTSMAAPQVAGQASLLISSGVDNQEVKPRIVNSAEDLGAEENAQGSGRVDVAESMRIDVEPLSADSEQGSLFDFLKRLLWFLN